MFESVQLTSLGQNIYTRGITTGMPPLISRVVIGDGVLPEGVTYDELGELVNPIFEPMIMDKQEVSRDIARIDINWTSAMLTEAITAREIGVFVIWPEGFDPPDGVDLNENREVLYAVQNRGANVEPTPPLGGHEFVKRTIRFLLKIANAASVQFVAPPMSEQFGIRYVTDHFVSEEGQQEFSLVQTQITGALQVIIEGAACSDFYVSGELVVLGYPLPRGVNVWIQEARVIVKESDDV